MTVLVVGEALVDVVRSVDGDVVHSGRQPAQCRRRPAAARCARRAARELRCRSVRDRDRPAPRGEWRPVTPSTVDDRPTSVAEATIGADGAASYRSRSSGIRHRLSPLPASFVAVHTGSIAAALEPGASRVEKPCSLRCASIRGDVRSERPPGSSWAIRPTHGSAVERLITLADVVKASDEDIAWLYPDVPVGDVIEAWRESDPALVVVTRGGAGADAVCSEGAVHVDAPPTVVADTIGAGDSIHGGPDHGVGRSRSAGRRASRRTADTGCLSVGEIVAFAARCAAITVSRPGADPPTRAELS